jgi:Domain of unknown function (DUF4385)
MSKDTLKNPPESPLPTPALDDCALCTSYTIGRGEKGVLTFEPYKSLILPYWSFRTISIAENSAQILWNIFESYCERGDFVGADMTRKFIQMGMTRSRRYANHKGGRKYGKNGEALERWTGDDVSGQRQEKEEASRIFKEYWQRCTRDVSYRKLKDQWSADKRALDTSRPSRTDSLSAAFCGRVDGDG